MNMGGYLYQKTVRVAIVNSSDVSSTVNFAIKGGYSYNDTNTIPLGDFTAVSDTLINEHIALSSLSESLNEKVSDILDCTPTNTSPCLYTNEMRDNYVSYSEMIWRIMGTYLIDDEIVTKLVQDSNYANNIGYTNISNSLTSLYNSLEEKDSFLKTDTDFLCTGLSSMSCTAHPNYLNIGLINKDEYIKVGGENSYLDTTNNYWTMTESGSQVYEITSSGEELNNTTSNSGIRTTIYINSEIEVYGNGTLTEPYTLASPSVNDLEVAMFLDGVRRENMTGVTSGYALESYSCTNGGTVSFDYVTETLSITPYNKTETECTFYFTSSPLLAQFVNQGDYIDYTGNNGCTGNACIGCNTSGASSPGSQCNNTLGYCYSTSNRYNSYGWRVAYVERNGTPDNYSDDSIYITTGGSPECTTEPLSVNNLATKYCNPLYVYSGVCDSNSVWNMNQTDFNKILGNTSTFLGCKDLPSVVCGLTNVIIDSEGIYYFATATSPYAYWYTQAIRTFNSNQYSFGIRPIIRLSSGITHDGTGNGTQTIPYKLNPVY